MDSREVKEMVAIGVGNREEKEKEKKIEKGERVRIKNE